MTAPVPPQSGDAARASILFTEAIAYQRQGLVSEAEALYRDIVALQSHHAPALHLLGAILVQRGALSEAIQWLNQSIDTNPNVAAAHVDLGIALQQVGRLDESMAHYDRAVALAPRLLPAQFNRAVLLQRLGRLAEALRGYERALKIEPKLVAAGFNRAVVLAVMRRPHEALAAYDDCLSIAPQHVEALTNRGVLLLELQRPADALQSFEAALRLMPDLATTLNGRGNALTQLGRHAEAVDSFDRAIALKPDFAEAYRNRGAALRQLGDHEAAVASYEAALRIRPDHPDTLLDRAHALINLKRHADAAECLDDLLRLAPQYPYAEGLRLHVKTLCGDWRDHAQLVEALVDANARGDGTDFPFSFLTVSDDAAAQLRCARRFASEKFPPMAKPLAERARYRHRKIRLAYVSGDFRPHPVSLLLARVFELHARERFETTAISLQPPDPSPLGKRVMAAFDTFLDVSSQSDSAVATLMREREIDIAVDLAGFTQGSRTAIFAARPAPVQVNFMGFPGSMGVPYMDYLIADPFLIPDGARQCYAEKIVWLPDCFQANDDQRPRHRAPASRRELGLPEIGLVLCCFNNGYKIHPPLFEIWMRLLAAVPSAVLWLASDTPLFERNLRSEAARRGVNADRLIFARRVPYDLHLARMACADVFLDTFPFNAGTTASDALWAGVPVLTCAGEAMASRMAGSLLHAVGIPELITESLADYEAMALRLATDADGLLELRRRLTAGRGAVLFDSARYCRHLESAYDTMWRRSEGGKAPQHFAVERIIP